MPRARRPLPPGIKPFAGMRGRQAFTLDQLEDALRKAAGIQAYAAAALQKASGRSFSRQAMYVRVQRSPRLQQVIAECIEEVKDLAEHGLIKNVKEGHAGSIFFLLDRLARDRGYGSQHSLTGADGEPLMPAFGVPQVNIYLPDNGRDPDFVPLGEHPRPTAKANGHGARGNGTDDK